MKINIRFIIALVVLFAAPDLFAQGKMLGMEEAILKGNTTLAAANLRDITFRDNTHFTYTSANNKLVQGSVSANTQDTILSLEQINAGLKTLSEGSLSRFPALSYLSKDQAFFQTPKGYFLYTFGNQLMKRMEKLPEGAENSDFCHPTHALAYTISHNLYIDREDGTAPVKVTANGTKDLVYGEAVHRNEWGILKGTFWSPKGSALAFYRMDQSMVTDYPLVDISARPATVNLIKYPMAGMKSHEVTVGVYNIASSKTVYLNTGLPNEQYLTNITWSPDESTIYIQVLNRAQNHMMLNSYDANTGAFIRTLFEEKSDKYVEPLHPLYFLKNRPEEFLYLSERDGFRHYYRYNTSGVLINQITTGKWIVTEHLGYDQEEKNVIYTSTMEDPAGICVYAANLITGKITRISQAPGSHGAAISPDGHYIIDKYSSLTVPRQIDLVSIKGKKIRSLLTADNPLTSYKLGETKLVKLHAADGTMLQCRMITPPDYDPAKKYPTVVYVYGGPHAQMVSNSWLAGGNLWFQLMAQQGYVMFTLDNRGSMNRGRDFEQSTFRQLGTLEIKDQLVGVDYLKTLSFVDKDRIGVHGWSFGGFMTTSLMSKTPGIFKAGVCGGPVIDWKYYEIMYTERYMDTPEENPKGYDEANLINFAQDLKGRLLMIHGTIDPVVVWQHSQMYLKKCVDEGIQLDYFVYPGHEHNVLGKDRVHLMQKVTDYFHQNL